MKYISARLLSVTLLFTLLLTACSTAATNVVTETADTAPPPTLGAYTPEVVLQTDAEQTAQSTPDSSAPPIMTGYLPKADAEAIAYEDAGVSAETISDLSCELFTTEETPYYELSFTSEGDSYCYRLNAENGCVLYSDCIRHAHTGEHENDSETCDSGKRLREQKHNGKH